MQGRRTTLAAAHLVPLRLSGWGPSALNHLQGGPSQSASPFCADTQNVSVHCSASVEGTAVTLHRAGDLAVESTPLWSQKVPHNW